MARKTPIYKAFRKAKMTIRAAAGRSTTMLTLDMPAKTILPNENDLKGIA